MGSVSSVRIGICLVALGLLVTFSGCQAVSDPNALTTRPGEQLIESMFLGKWDLHGDRTNTANGNTGVNALPSDITKNIFGTGWRFEPEGVLKIDTLTGSRPGTWKIQDRKLLVIYDEKNDVTQLYSASFRLGYLYLKDESHRVWVMQQTKRTRS